MVVWGVPGAQTLSSVKSSPRRGKSQRPTVTIRLPDAKAGRTARFSRALISTSTSTIIHTNIKMTHRVLRVRHCVRLVRLVNGDAPATNRWCRPIPPASSSRQTMRSSPTSPRVITSSTSWARCSRLRTVAPTRLPNSTKARGPATPLHTSRRPTFR